ncbi:hypothetical protein [Planktothrix agardhii]|jgi:hypothetical protein|nr:hypothetical protein [Planktothrix agardhii]MCF3607827.1 hypothetical protein [Planktothrix agardhii 1033]MCB8760949.1 hypothetical protein [Planktothrix agardhii 1813]MCB8785641.1 hypothetical protein [Planktothrix agardhii 1025]MCF3609447.1 hypothetical protein [Planktothrix agardhii 1033]MCF3612639.1 hypothetical protein [Planktothrix agardhii 1027]
MSLPAVTNVIKMMESLPIELQDINIKMRLCFRPFPDILGNLTGQY